MPRGRYRMGEADFARVVNQAIARIPAKLRAYLDNIVITVQPRPSPELLADLGLPPDEPLFGVYLGVPLTERSSMAPPLYPDAIHIFQEVLEDYCTSRAELLEEIEITVVHEVAHLFGFTDDYLVELGYG